MKRHGRPRRPARKLRRLIVALLCFLVLSNEIMLACFFARYEPKTSYENLPAEAETVHFRSGNAELTGWLLDREDAPGLVLICHGFHSSAADQARTVNWFWEHGWDVLAFDGTGVGRSEGASMLGLQQMALDAKAAVQFIGTRAELKDEPLLVFGHSAGAYAAAILCGDGLADTAVCVAGFDAPLDMMVVQAGRYVGPLVWVGYAPLWAHEQVLYGGNANRRASDLLARNDVPVLVIHGDSDEVVPDEQSLYKALADDPDCTLLRLESFRHSSVLYDEQGVVALEAAEHYFTAFVAEAND